MGVGGGLFVDRRVYVLFARIMEAVCKGYDGDEGVDSPQCTRERNYLLGRASFKIAKYASASAIFGSSVTVRRQAFPQWRQQRRPSRLSIKFVVSIFDGKILA